MFSRPHPTVVDTIKHVAGLLTGAARRKFQAKVVLDYFDGNTSQTTTVFGWGEPTLRRALQEQETGEIIPDAPRSGRQSYSQKLPNLQDDIRSLVDPNTCTHPTFQTTFRYTRMTALAVLDALVREKGYKKKELPAESTMRDLLNKMGYRLQRVQKTKPKKRFLRRTRFSPI
jgi:hypothetical protein